MTGRHQPHGGTASADGPFGLGAVVPARERAEPPPLPATAWSNVVPFARPRAHPPAADSAPRIVVDAARRPAPRLSEPAKRARMLALIALSLAAHAGLYFASNREAAPMASVGLEAIAVELVLGANSPAGAASTSSQNETQSAPTPARQTEPDRTEVEARKPPEEIADPPRDTAQTQAPAPFAEPPPEPAAEAPEPPKAEVKPQPAPTPPKPAPERDAQPKPAPKREAVREAPRGGTVGPKTNPGPRANASNDVGAGRSANNANYHGLVAAHLARYKRFPPEAQRNGAQGAATVRFTLSGSGGVTGVALVRGTGVAALDQEAVAMVHRAAPFPAPPDGRPQSFTVPVSYHAR